MDRFEEKAKEILKDHEVPFNAAHWDQLNARLDQADKKSKKGIWFWMIGTGVAAALAIALLLSNGNDELNELANEVETPTQEEKQINDTEITQTETNQINRSLGDTLGTLFDNEVADASKSNNGIFQKESNTAIDPLENNDLDDALLAANSVTFEEQNKSLKYIIIEKLKWTFGNDLTNVLSHEFQQLEIEKLKITEPSVVPLDAGINLVVNASDYAAYAGVESGHNLILKSNANWIGVVDKKTQEFDRFTLSTPTNFMANYNFAFGNESKWSLGANYFNSQASRWSKNEFGANIGYRIDFDKDGWFRINTGLNVSHTSVDLAYLTWVDMIDPTYGYVQGSEETLSPTSDVLYQTWGGFGKFKNFFGSFDLSNLKLTYLINSCCPQLWSGFNQTNKRCTRLR